ncbi:MAG: glycosyltransferase [Vicinamibacterales bacterium]
MAALPFSQPVPGPTVAVAVVCICSAEHLAHCLDALRSQQDAGTFQIVVCHDPSITGIELVTRRFPEARISSNAAERTPLELAAAVLRSCTADVILLTEDHCIPRHDWVRSMLAARAPGRAVVGGRIEIRPGASALDWAFYYADFFRYAAPVIEGPSPTLTVCNVAYDRAQLDAIRDVWSGSFEEPAVHNALRERFGVLWLTPDSEVAMRRSVSLYAALAERYAFGRIFGHTRIAHVSTARRCLYAVVAPALPVLLLGRMAMKAVRSSRLARNFVRGFLPLAAMVLCWSWGEWLGYVTGRPPHRLALAPELPSMDVSRPGTESRSGGQSSTTWYSNSRR